MKIALLALSLSLSFACTLHAAEPSKVLRARRVADHIKVDGRLDEPDWQNLPAATDFTQDWPDLGRPATLKTEAWVLYDDNHVYVGARMHHPQGKASVAKAIHRRDHDSASDWFGVYIDSLLDRSTAFGFLVNAGGVQQDVMCYSDTETDTSWDGVWESAVSIDENGWTAEMKIPLVLLRIRPGGGPQTWGINFYRKDEGAVREYTYWEHVPRGQTAFVSRFPLLVGIEGLRPRLRHEWIPYISSQRKFETTERTFDDRHWLNRVGLDAHFGVTTASQLDLTVWPDFGQVEVDDSVINLGTLETFFPEKRPFFLEGTDIFRVVGQNLLYSRRIGRGIALPEPSKEETILDAPRVTDIGLAAKYTAKTSGGLNFGLLGASVEPARAEMLDADGNEFEREVYPLSNFGVMRVQQFLDKRGSFIGGFASYMHQAGETGREAKAYAVDGVFKSRDLSTTIQASMSMTDAGRKNTDSREGHRITLNASRKWNSGLSLELTAHDIGRDFNPNDVGYLSRADLRQATFSIGQHIDRRWWTVRNCSGSLGVSAATDQAGVATARAAWGRLVFNFMNFWYLSLEGGADLSCYDDRELRTFRDPVKKYLKTKDQPYFYINADTALNKPYYARVSWTRQLFDGGPSDNFTFNQIVRPHSALEIKLGTGYTEQDGEMRYVERTDQGTPPIVALRRLSALDQTLRLSYAIDTNLTVQFYSQWLVGAWNFRDYSQYVSDDELAAWSGQPSRTAESSRNWTVNLITRWEFRPGSTAYLVYTHGASTDQLISQNGSISPWRDLSILNRLQSDDVVQLKVSWMFQ